MTIWKDIVLFSALVLAGMFLGVIGSLACTSPQKHVSVSTPTPTSTPAFDKIVITKPDGTKIEAPGNASVKVPVTSTKTVDKGAVLTSASGTSHGNTITGSADKITQDLKTTAPTLNLEEGTGDAGTLTYKLKAITTSGATPYVIVGIILIIVACLVGIWLKKWVLAIALFVAAIIIISVGVLVDTAPWVFCLIPIAIIIVVVAFIYISWKNKSLDTASTDIITTIESLMPSLISGIKNGASPPITFTSIADSLGIPVDKLQIAAGQIVQALKKEVSNTSALSGGITSKVVKSIVG